MKVIFSHGKESGPWGTKIKHLAEIAKQQGFDVDSIDYSGINDPDQRVQKLRHIINNESERNIVLVGSSMGGYVSLIASESKNVNALFLLAPALYMPSYDIQQYDYSGILIEIIHGWSDDIIPVEHSIKFAKKHHHGLHLIDGDHRLNSSLDTVAVLFKQFLEKTEPC
jgi:predicted esterase